MTSKLKIMIIGGGVGGYPAAIKAARMGAEVTLVEKDLLGGTCLNRGCIPTKSLLHAGEVVQTMQVAETFGVHCKGYIIDFAAMMARKKAVVNQLRNGVQGLLKKKKVNIIQGSARLIEPGKVKIAETGEVIQSDKVLIATGSKPRQFDSKGSAGLDLLNSDQALELAKLPKSVVIIGGGVIGLEFAQIFNRLGVEVTVLELLEDIAAGIDTDIASVLRQIMTGSGINIITGADIQRLSKKKGLITVHYNAAGAAQTAVGEKIIVAVGRVPVTEGLGAEKIGLAVEKGALVVSDQMETNLPGVYAAGDVTGKTMLAHAAAAQSECAVDAMFGRKRLLNYRTIPGCIYTSPEVGCVGLTETAAREQFDIEVARFPLVACGKALVVNETEGFVKIVADKKYGEILGVHIVGPRATDLIAEAVLGMSMEMTIEELANAVHPHPTLSESLMEAAMSIHGGAIHIP
jgi:dihydrolipoamide dehydrogenase